VSFRDRLGAWLVTGPVGRLVAFFADLGAAVIRGAINKWRLMTRTRVSRH
jgi:hypothetical protein